MTFSKETSFKANASLYLFVSILQKFEVKVLNGNSELDIKYKNNNLYYTVELL